MFRSLIIFFATIKGILCSCTVHVCSGDFLESVHNLKEGSFYPYCSHLDKYMKCIEQRAHNCHGDLTFHVTKGSVDTLWTNYHCQRILQEGSEANPQPEHASSEDNGFYSNNPYNEDPCGLSLGRSPLSHCGLFGDPHLKTFNNTFQTCRVRGAWPILSSEHLSIQVTNEPVGDNFKATATTKVTVLIKGDPQCGLAKTYEASKEELPKAFVDGTTYSGENKSSPYIQVVEALPGQHIIIRVKRINSTVNIRKVGKYLTVSVTAPLEVVKEIREKNSGDLQLCDTGCPESEILVGGNSLVSKETQKMSQKKARTLCAEYNITDYYLDSCVFDLQTTGDTTFREAAYLALKDMWHNDPKASSLILKNCTNWPCLWSISSTASGTAILTLPLLLWSILILLVP